MKTVHLFSLIIMLFISCHLYSQTITYKEIVVNWYTPDTISQKSLFRFINTSNLIIQDAAGNKIVFNYKLLKDDSIGGEDLLLIKSKIPDKTSSLSYSIEKIDNNILRLINLDPYDTITMNVSQINKGIIYLVKKK